MVKCLQPQSLPPLPLTLPAELQLPLQCELPLLVTGLQLWLALLTPLQHSELGVLTVPSWHVLLQPHLLSSVSPGDLWLLVQVSLLHAFKKKMRRIPSDHCSLITGSGP